jgi:hypothetical protein
VKVRPVPPSPARLARHRQIERSRGLPLFAKAFLALAVVALGASILWIGSGGIGPFVASVANGFGGFVDQVGNAVGASSPTPPPSVSDAPMILAPDEAYTNLETVDVSVNVPAAVVGVEGYSVRIWVTLKDAAPAVLAEVDVGPTATLVIPGVQLASGRNDLQASIVGPAGESDRSPVVAWVLDQVAPKITITSPKANASVSKTSVVIKGKTQARTTIVIRNDANSATASTEADKDGLFEATVAIAAGVNAITLTATDPAGNTNSKAITVRKGSGKLQVQLSGSVYRFKASKLPRNVTFTVVVTGPDGRRVKGATALFTVTVPGLEAIVSAEVQTGSDGSASFSTKIPKGALPGSGLASVLVTTDDYGTATDRQVLTVQ